MLKKARYFPRSIGLFLAAKSKIAYISSINPFNILLKVIGMEAMPPLTTRAPDEATHEVWRQFLGDDVIMPPTEDELPYDDGEPMESDRHALQLELLKEPLILAWSDKPDVCIAGNMGVYYSLEQVSKQNFRAPDFFIALDVEKRFRKSYVIWQEGKALDLVIELLSDSTAAADRGIKKQIYQDKMRVNEYILFDVATATVEAYRLAFSVEQLRRIYQPLSLGKESNFVCEVAPNLGLMVWEGEFRSRWGRWLRWYDTSTNEVLPTGAEMAKVERKSANEERERANEINALLEIEREKAAQMAEKLRALGINPEDF
jgi:Uma2 family endonuclease